MTAPIDDVAAEMARLSKKIDAGVREMADRAREYAEAERAYRKEKSAAWLRAPAGNVPQRQAWVDAETADLRFTRDLADGMRQVAVEALRARRAQVSAWQSLLAAQREEASFARTGPGMAA